MDTIPRGAEAGYISMSRLSVAPDHSDELIEAFRRRAGLVDDAQGFRGLQVWRSDTDPTEVVMVSFWRNRADFKAYMRSAEHQVSHDRIPEHLQQAITLQRLEHLRTYDLVAE